MGVVGTRNDVIGIEHCTPVFYYLASEKPFNFTILLNMISLLLGRTLDLESFLLTLLRTHDIDTDPIRFSLVQILDGQKPISSLASGTFLKPGVPIEHVKTVNQFTSCCISGIQINLFLSLIFLF